MLAISKKEIKSDDIVKLLGTPEKESLLGLLRVVGGKDAKGIVGIISQLQSGNSSAVHSYDDMIELVRQGLLMRIGETTDGGELSTIAKEYPYTINSKTILELLEKKQLLEVSDAHAWTAFTAVLLSLIVESKP